MEDQVRNPLVVRCENCGGDLGFDIAKQRYVCAHCGAESTIDNQKAQFRHWRSLRNETVMKDVGKVKSFACPACGAQTFAESENATAVCPFCQNTMIDSDFAGNDLPEVIIPFKLNKEEAEAKLRTWLKGNSDNPAAQAIEKNMLHFTGCYLPYHIVRGAINSDMQIRIDDKQVSDYPFRAYLKHTAVNASKDWDNLFLDGIEPFDFEEAREFEFGYLNRQNAKVQNVTNEELKTRIDEETRAELYKSLTKKNRTKEMSILLDDNDKESIPALMPVYLVKGGDGIAAAVNGQTGKVSVATGKTKNLTRHYWIAPVLFGILVTLVLCIIRYKTSGAIELGNSAWIGLFFGFIYYAIARSRHKKEIVNEVLTYPDSTTDHNDTQSEFFTDFGDGPVPAQLRFFTPWRIIKSVVVVLAVVFLPLLIAIPIQLIRSMPLADIKVSFGAAWYLLFGSIAMLSLGGMAQILMYKAPIFREILPRDLTQKRKPRTKKHSLLHSFWNNYKATLSTRGGVLFTIFLALLLAGSVYFMIA